MTKPTAKITSITFSGGQSIDIGENDKVLLVGPNNSGKSLTLREIFDSANAPEDVCHRNLVVKDLNFHKSGDSAALRNYLEEVGTLEQGYYLAGDWRFNESAIDLWDLKNLLPHSASCFIRNITTEARLRITERKDARLHDGQNKSAQHVLLDNDELMEKISQLFFQAFNKDIFFDFRSLGRLSIHMGARPVPESIERDRVSDHYVEKVRSFPLLHEQGDGVRSYAGILFEAVATERDITLIDEPEAFLHPPQMRKLGKTLAAEVKGQLLVATHSSDIMRGFLSGTGGSVRIVRMQRHGNENHVIEASLDTIRKMWEQLDLRYSNALDGIFHEQVIICEDDSDCKLFNSVADHMEEASGKPWRDTAFVPAGGKHRIHKIAAVLREVGVPVTGVYDIDLLSEGGLVKSAVEGFGGDWSEIMPLWSRVNAAVTNGIKPVTNDEIKGGIIRVLNESVPGNLPRGDVEDLLRSGKPWAEVKKHGRTAIPKGEAQIDFERLDSELNKVGIVVVPVGQVENFRRDIGLHGTKFVNKLLLENSLDDDRMEDLRNFVKKTHCLRGNPE